MNNHPQKPQQTNIANIQRSAGNDYHETRIDQIHGNKLLLMIMPDEELDRISIGNDKLFYKRFGQDFDLELRQKIIALKQGYAWTEKELRLIILIMNFQLRITNFSFH